MATRAVAMTVSYTAWDTDANVPKTGDVANHTLRWIKDGTPAVPSNAATEVDATNAPGQYKITLTSTETDADIGTLAGKSSTTNIVLIPVQVQFERLPNAAPGAAGGVARVQDVPTAAGNATAVRTELTTELGRVDAAVSTRATPADVLTQLNTYDGPTKAEMDAAIDGIPGATTPVSLVVGSVLPRTFSQDVEAFIGEEAEHTLVVTDNRGNAVDLSGIAAMTLILETKGTDKTVIQTVLNAALDRTDDADGIVRWTNNAAATLSARTLRYVLRSDSGKVRILRGDFKVSYEPGGA